MDLRDVRYAMNLLEKAEHFLVRLCLSRPKFAETINPWSDRLSTDGSGMKSYASVTPDGGHPSARLCLRRFLCWESELTYFVLFRITCEQGAESRGTEMIES